MVKRARFAFTMDSLCEPVVEHRKIGGRAVFEKIPRFASPPHDGFALDDLAMEEVCPQVTPSVCKDRVCMT